MSLSDTPSHQKTRLGRMDDDAYAETLTRVETYFDRNASDAWERLTSRERVSRIRQTVRNGRDRMRALMLSRLPADLSGARVLDAGCGAGQMAQELAKRGAEVVAVDIAPAMLEVARRRLPEELQERVTFVAGDLVDNELGHFDHAVAMDSLIYYETFDLCSTLAALDSRVADSIVFTVAPRTPILMAMWGAGRLFPKSDRAPIMVPQDPFRLARNLRDAGCVRELRPVERISTGFYVSHCLEVRE